MTLESFAKWWIVAIMALHIVGTVLMIGRPRKLEPITASHGIFTAIFWGLYITAIIMFWETS